MKRFGKHFIILLLLLLCPVLYGCAGKPASESTADPDSDRYSFRLNLGKYVKGQTYHGLDKLSLNNSVCDASYLKDFLCYEDKSFLERNYGGRGVIYKPESSGLGLTPDKVDASDLDIRDIGAFTIGPREEN